jgi:N-acetylglucosaminyl-diphospho-decaprenol L-rhamnosyltransferase
MSGPGATVDVAIVNWNTGAAALEAAEAFAASEGASVAVTIIDNLSKQEDRALLEARCPEGVRLILSPRNLGYGAAANLALRDGQGELVCVSNADVSLEPAALAALAEAAMSGPDTGMVGPVFDDRTHDFHSHLPRPSALLMRSLVGSYGRDEVSRPEPGEVIEVEQPSGALFVVRRDVWERHDGFDEDFFMWYEDVDLAKRLHDAGARGLVVGAARARHVGGLSMPELDRRHHQAMRLDGLERYLRKHHPRATPLARPLLGASRIIRG